MIICEITSYKRVPEGDVRSSHMRFLKEYGEKGKILMAGRFADSKGAMIIWDVESFDEVRAIAKTDPYVTVGLVDYELREWPVLFNYTTSPPKVWSG